jgi:hypothetical protein
MTEDTIRMAREANRYASHQTSDSFEWQEIRDERLAALAAAAQREKLAHWMRNMGYATGHGDTIEDLLDHLGTQIAEGLEAEREACAKVAEATVCDIHLPTGVRIYGSKAAAAIRARSKT